MKILILQHAANEGAGSILEWCNKRNVSVTYLNLYEPHPKFDASQDYQLMVILGGAMSVNDERELPWLKPEKQFIRQMIEANIPTLGICLGAQLIATALGSTVGANPETEIGWHQVRNVAHNKPVFQLADSLDAFHWHGETFQLPDNAIRLAESKACVNQGYQIGDRVIGLQFHPEVTLETMGLWIEDAGDSLKTSTYVQTPEQMNTLAATYLDKAHSQLDLILDYLVSTSSSSS